MDKVLKEHFDRFMEKGQLPPELRELAGVKLFANAKLLKEWRNNLKGIEWYDGEGNKLHGAVDNLLEKDDKLIVLDYKTRGFPLKEDTHEHYQDQMDIYNFLLRKKGYKTEDYSYLLFYHPTTVLETGEVVFHTDLVKIQTSVRNAEKILSKALDVLGKEMPEANAECGFCRMRAQNF